MRSPPLRVVRSPLEPPLRLIKYDTFSEDVTKFYMAECILAIEAVHKLGFIHR